MIEQLRTSRVRNVSRRRFLEGMVGAGGLVLGMQLVPRNLWADEASGAAGGAFSPNVFLSIGTDGTVTIVAHRSEMGTGIRTSLPMVVADELEADWSRVRIEQAPGDEKYGSQNTDGSRSIRRFYQTMREAGATARQMLETAASQRWGVAAGECSARLHEVVHEPSGRTLGFGELAADAAGLPAPKAEQLVFKARDRWRYVGRDVPSYDIADITTGRATFGADVRLDGMKYAAIARCPVLGGTARSYDDAEALAVPGVEAVVEIPASRPPHGFNSLGGIAVVASNTWAAFEGRKKLRIDWDLGENSVYDSASYRRQLEEAVRKPGRVVRETGDVDAALAAASRVVEADYYAPHLAHAPMEPPCATARVSDTGCEAWAPTQNPQAAQMSVASALGLDRENVTVHVTLLGGGFGRKSKPDYVVEAARLAKEVGAPVQVVWSREDDLHHGYYHACAAMHFEAGLDDAGRPQAWLQRSAFPSISSTFMPGVKAGSADELALGFTDAPYDLPSLRCENGEATAHVRIGWLRSVCNVFHAFGVSSFADELAAAAGRDPKDYLLELIGRDRHIDLSAQGVQYSNYGEPLDRFPIDTARLRHVLERAADNAGWGRDLPRGHGLGLAVHRSFLTYVAIVIEAKVDSDGTLTMPRVNVVADCGLVVSPDRVRAQMEGAAVFGASLALYGEVTAREGRIEQGNFHDYRMARMHDAPREVRVELIESDAPPAGAGEPGVPPFAPALCNAIFAATGKRIRSLPLSKHDLSWS